jgi:hypothetical protein
MENKKMDRLGSLDVLRGFDLFSPVSSVIKSVFYGTEQFLGDYYATLVKLGNVSIIFFILLAMYRKKMFLKV